MKTSLFFRLFTGYLFVIFTLTGLTLLVLWSSIERHYMSTLTSALRNSALMAEPAVLPLLEANRLGDLSDVVRALGKETRTRITVIDVSGRVLADSEQNARTMENHKNRPEFATALEGDAGSVRRYSSTANQDMLYVAVPIERFDGQIVGALRTSFFLRNIDGLLTDLRQKMVRIALFLALFALAAAAFLSRTVSRPIQELTRAVRKVTSGDFSVRVYPRTGGEIRQLSDSFNAMSDHIDEMVLELKHQKEELHSIIASLQEGLVVMDSQGKILMTNKSFERIAGHNRVAKRAEDAGTSGSWIKALPADAPALAPAIEGRSYWQAVRNTNFIELIQKVQEKRASFTEELQLNDRVFICSATYLPSRDETVAVFHDITEIRDMERLKRDFVVNVSHELRTPLTAIKGFTETLEEEVPSDARHYLGIIKRNTDRLISIINDLLLLSELEEKGMRLELEEVDLKDLIENVARVFEQPIREKGLRLSLAIQDDLPLIKGDVFKLEQLIINLLDNAVKYSEAGEVRAAARTGGNATVVIQVRDTGIGIPPEDIPRIFERFYVVDKSRSKKVGGTGLGLSIVKHIVLLHNGTIEVTSTPGEGTGVTVTLPLDPSPKTA